MILHMPTSRLLTTSEVAQRLGVTRATIINRIDAGTITPSGVAGMSTGRRTYYFTEEAVTSLAEERAAELIAEADRLTAQATR